MPTAVAVEKPADMQVGHIIEAFKSWDETGSGLISREDLATIIKLLSPGLNESDLDKLFRAAGKDGLTLGGNTFRYEDFVTWLWAPNGRKKAKAKATSSSSRAAAEETFDPADEERRRKGLWEAALAAAEAKGCESYAADKVKNYFHEIRARICSEEYARHVKGQFFQNVDSDQDGKISFDQVASIIAKPLQFAADMVAGPKPTMEEVHSAFDAHDTLVVGRGHMGVDEFLNLMKYLQVRVAEAAMPMSRMLQSTA